MKKLNITQYEQKISLDGYQLIAGIDEVGRGCMAGPVVVAICIFPFNYQNDKIDDSKKLSPKKRLESYCEIIRDCVDYHVEIIDANEVDLLNPKQASIVGMERCALKINTRPDYLLIDAEKINSPIPSLSIIKGDTKSISIAGASIIAKVTRDQMMIELSKIYPLFHFEKHKGYVTKIHMEALKKYGPIKDVHRFSYKPVKNNPT